ncbi:acyl-CoA dehydrogenase [Actinacidiphila sp. ITFR-21]|uniref:acyl-CoA dehydrogenase family protein n=1 Tax=Actinacidiphila sp. ITFR-21 TaxID=3075199 RepID=UPI00288AC351|nr:acyl-CoA dehydrogenase [Streptomyces sp. ITFR-21]WNI14377.1 acyl-CoA dehydrogenase [Streptomyces sp. ITFR-21]
MTGTEETLAELTALLADGRQNMRAELAGHFAGPHFDDTGGEPGPPAAVTARAYARLAELNRYVHPARDLLADVHRLTALHEWAAITDGTLFAVMASHYNLVLAGLLRHAARRPDLGPLATELEELRAVGVFMASELGYGNNLVALETEARYDPAAREFVLHTPRPRARKFMPNTSLNGVPKLAVVLARTFVDDRECGVLPFLVRLTDGTRAAPGVRIVPLPGKPVLALDNAVTSFDRVRVGLDALLADEHGELAATGTLGGLLRDKIARFLGSIENIEGSKICLTAGSLAMSRAGLAIAVRYAGQRRTFAPGRGQVVLADYRTHHTALTECLAATYALSFLFNDTANTLARQRENGEPLDEATVRQIAICKALTSWNTRWVLEVCRERCGAQGLFSMNRIMDYLVVNHGVVTAEGDNEVIMIKAGRQLLDEPHAVPAGTDPRTGPDGPGAAGSPPADTGRWWLWLLGQRAAGLRQDVLQGLRAGERARDSVFGTWNSQVEQVRQLAETCGRRSAAAALFAAAERAVAPAVGALLEDLAEVYTLRCVEEDFSWFAGHGLLGPEEAADLEARRGRLHSDLAAQLPLLTRAFAIPDAVLRSPLASDDYLEAYEEWLAAAAAAAPLGEGAR